MNDLNTRILTPEEIRARQPDAIPTDALTPLERTRARVERAGQWNETQHLGRRFAIGCVALEITQRCNLDCTLCYLSESSEALKDIPLEEVFRRIDMIHTHYGPGTDVQVTGGDPTLRKADEIVQIVRYIRSKGMRASFFTNGILAKHELLKDLVAAGLTDIAFHVDMTQERKGFANEMELNVLRDKCIEQASGLKLQIFFNTTVFDGNFHEIPQLARYFADHADRVQLASFQLQADTGRGVLHERGYEISTASVQTQIERGIGNRLEFGGLGTGHPDCNRSAITLVANGHVHGIFSNLEYAGELLRGTAKINFDRANKKLTGLRVLLAIALRPKLAVHSIIHYGCLAWRMRGDVWRARGRVHALGFFIHNFMDAEHLQCDRVNSCSFMVMTPDGPLSMCLHNAKRDDYLVRPIKIKRDGEAQWWNPVTGTTTAALPDDVTVQLTRKNARGRAKQALDTCRKHTAEEVKS
ncbi:MAG: radical SAM protein [Gammaproteobacteria bacterium]